MNAYELADEIKKERASEYVSPVQQRWLFQFEKMLRQQADRIAELEKQLNLHKKAHHKAIAILKKASEK